MKNILTFLLLLLPLCTFAQSKEADSLISSWRDMVSNYRNKKQYADAIKYQTLIVERRKKINGKKHADYLDAKKYLETLLLFSGESPEADVYYKKGIELYEARQAHLAMPYFEKSDSIEKRQSSKNFRSEIAMIWCRQNLINYYLSINDLPEAIRLQTHIVKSLKKMEGKKHPETIIAQNNLMQYRLKLECPEADEYYEKGVTLYKTHQAHLAIPYFEKSDSIERSKFPKLHRSELQLIQCWHDLAAYNADIKDTTEAIRLQTLATNKSKQLFGAKHPSYIEEKKTLSKYIMQFSNKQDADFFYNLGMEYYTKIRHPYNAAINFIKADSLEKLTLKPDSPNYNRSKIKLSVCWEWLSLFYIRNNNYGEAIRYQKLAVELREQIYGKEHEFYLSALESLARIYDQYLNDYDEAVKLQTQAEQISKKIFGEEHNKYVKSLFSLSSFKKHLNDHEGAIELMKKVVELSKKIYGEDSEEYVEYLTSLAYDYKDVGNHNEAIRLQTKVAEFKKNKYGEDHPLYADALSSLATFCAESGNYSEAIKIASKAIEIFKKDSRDNSWSYVTTYSNLADWNYKLGNYTEAIRLLNLAMEYTDRQEWAISSIMRMFADNYLAIGQYDKAKEVTEKAYSKSYSDETTYLAERFAFFTNKERTNFWNDCSSLYCNEFPRVASIFPDSTLCSIAYNGQVFAKGFLLNSELEILRLFEQKGSPALVERYHKLKQDRTTLDELYNISEAERTMDADSLARAIDNEEHKLVQFANELGNYTKNLLIDWRDIQRNLKDGDLAIEFANFKDTAKQTIYVALVLKKGMNAPEIVKLFESDTFYDIKPKEYYTTTKLYNLIWQPLAKYLDGAKSVYFSPVGNIHTIGIEYLSGDDGKIFAEQFDTYRLSSTRELALNRTANPNKKATTYGGIQYEFTPDEWRSLKNDNFEPDNYRDIPKIADNMRGMGMGYLDGTKLESASIATLLRSANYEVDAFSDDAATEESFKRLSGSGLKILHIGTHGFYESASDMQNAGYKFFTENQQSSEDLALSCSGLLFAGANSALDPRRNKEIPEGADDGILTAKEISRLDFNGLDLVVLSACQTGLGEITGEGVFGLQRGFKKAGAQTIVMSLWKVADESTQLLMVEFFKHLTAGQSKRAAFIAAQKTVRQKYPHPLHWAAFVMGDGIE